MFCTGMASLQCGIFHVFVDFHLKKNTYHKICTGMASLQCGFFHGLEDFPYV